MISISGCVEWALMITCRMRSYFTLILTDELADMDVVDVLVELTVDVELEVAVEEELAVGEKLAVGKELAVGKYPLEKSDVDVWELSCESS